MARLRPCVDVRRDLERAQSRLVVEDLAGEHQLVGLRRGDQGLQPLPDRLRPSRRRRRASCARRAPVRRLSNGLPCSSTGGESGPGWPRTRFRKACCNEVNRRWASASVSAAKTLTPTIAYGSIERLGGLEAGPVEVEGRVQVVGREVRGEREGQSELGGEAGADSRSTPAARAARPALRPGSPGPPGRASRGGSRPATPGRPAGRCRRCCRASAGAPGRSAGRRRGHGRGRGRSGPGRAIRACRTARRSPAARGSAA